MGECEGSGNDGPGGAIGEFGGIGAESKIQDGGKEWIIEEEGDRKGGLGSDSSLERLGTEGVDGNRNGGIEGEIDKDEDCRKMSAGLQGRFCGGELRWSRRSKEH